MKYQPMMFHSLVAYLLSGIKIGQSREKIVHYHIQDLVLQISYLLTHTDKLISLGVKFSQIVMNLKILNNHRDQ